MKILIYFSILIFSVFVHAESLQIILDPFQDRSEMEQDKEPESAEDSISADAPAYISTHQKYTAECSLTAIENGFSEQCLLKDIQYTVEQCSSETETNDTSNDGVHCPLTDVIRDNVDTAVISNYPLEAALEHSTYLKECSLSLYEDGSYSAYCTSPEETDEENISENFSEGSEDSEDSEDSGDFETVHSSEEEQILDKTYYQQEEIVVPELVESTANSISKLIVQLGPNEQAIGSGFFIKDSKNQSVLITSYHVFGVILQRLFRRRANKQDWFSKDSNLRFYAQQGDQKFRIKGVRDMSLIMDLSVLEVENYTGDTLRLAENYSSETPIYVLGYPAGHNLKKIKADHPFLSNELGTSYMISTTDCYTLSGVSGSPALNSKGEVVGVSFATNFLADCVNLMTIPLKGFENIDLMSSLKTNKEDIADLIREQELLFYNQLLFNSALKKDLMFRASIYVENNIFFSDFAQSVTQDNLLNIDQQLSESETKLSEEDKYALRFFVQKNIANMQGMDIETAAQLGSIDAKFRLGYILYIQRQFEESYQLWQELVQLRIPLHLYVLSQIYYREQNFSQSCRLLTYAEESVSALDDLYKQYECDRILSQLGT